MNDKDFLSLLTDLTNSDEYSNDFITSQIEKYVDRKTISANPRTENFFNILVNQKMKNIEENKIPDALPILNDLYAKYYGNYRTIDSILSIVVRKPLAVRFGLNSKLYLLSKKLVKIPTEEKEKLINDEENKKAVKNRKPTKIDLRNLLSVIKNNLNSDDIYRQAIALLICVGSRPNEFFLHSTYEESPQKNLVVQKYIAKRKDSTESFIEKPLVYLEPKDFIQRATTLRTAFNQRYKRMTNEKGQLTSSISSQGNKVMRELFPDEKTLFYNCRKYYGLLAHSIYAPESNYTQFLKDVFDHKSANTTLAYSHFTPEIIEEKTEKKIESAALTKKQKKKQNELVKVENVYNKFKKDKGTDPSQNKLEELCKDIPRSSVRTFYKQIVS